MRDKVCQDILLSFCSLPDPRTVRAGQTRHAAPEAVRVLAPAALLHDVAAVVVAQASAQLLVVHARLPLALAPQPRHLGRRPGWVRDGERGGARPRWAGPSAMGVARATAGEGRAARGGAVSRWAEPTREGRGTSHDGRGRAAEGEAVPQWRGGVAMGGTGSRWVLQVPGSLGPGSGEDKA